MKNKKIVENSLKKELFYGNHPNIFGWYGIIFHNIILATLLILHGYGKLDFNINSLNNFFIGFGMSYMALFKIVHKWYEKKFGNFEKEYNLRFVQFLYCINEYVIQLSFTSIYWMVIFHYV